MKDNQKILCIAISLLVLYIIYKEFFYEYFGNMLVGQVPNNNQEKIPLFYR
jgi:hypothetical protein